MGRRKAKDVYNGELRPYLGLWDVIECQRSRVRLELKEGFSEDRNPET